jgi:hypothetical protein
MDRPTKREAEMLRLRTVEGLTLREIGERYGVTDERVRQLLRSCYRLRGVPPAAQARGWPSGPSCCRCSELTVTGAGHSRSYRLR